MGEVGETQMVSSASRAGLWYAMTCGEWVGFTKVQEALLQGSTFQNQARNQKTAVVGEGGGLAMQVPGDTNISAAGGGGMLGSWRGPEGAARQSIFRQVRRRRATVR